MVGHSVWNIFSLSEVDLPRSRLPFIPRESAWMEDQVTYGLAGSQNMLLCVGHQPAWGQDQRITSSILRCAVPALRCELIFHFCVLVTFSYFFFWKGLVLKVWLVKMSQSSNNLLAMIEWCQKNSKLFGCLFPLLWIEKVSTEMSQLLWIPVFEMIKSF